MVERRIVEPLNRQLNFEFQSAYLYLSMASYCLSINLNGFSLFMRKQSKEELDHGMRFYDFLHEA